MLRSLCLSVFIAISFAALAQRPTNHQTMEVTATKVPEEASKVPVAMTLIDGEDLQMRGAENLSEALSLVSGVTVAPGGDGGPAGSVPEFFGLREFDAFLLVVDGVPWGGAFNPALTSLSLENVKRIEVMRGPAPVTYGATSFVGVIQVIHYEPGEGENSYRLGASSYAGGSVALNYNLPPTGNVDQSLSVNLDRQGFKDDRTESEIGHLLYRLVAPLSVGRFHLDADAHLLRQEPASPHPREGTRLTDRVAVDSNFNPEGAHQDQERFHLALGYDLPLTNGALAAVLSLTHTSQDNLRGFLGNLDETNLNAAGYTQEVKLDDLYLDVHWSTQLDQVHLLVGADFLAGKGRQESENFRYFIPLDGNTAPSLNETTLVEKTEMEDERGFGSLYVHNEWTPNDRFRLDLGARLSLTHEKVEGEAEPFGEEEEEEEEGGEESVSFSKLSGVIGFSYLVFRADQGGMWVFADYRDTFKPAALDFGPEAEAEILDPETAQTYELGLKYNTTDFDLQVSAFSQDFDNLVVAQNTNGFPQLVNAGKERFQGVELESRLRFGDAFRLNVSYSYHDAKFRDYERLFDGVPFQLSGNRLELSARNMAGIALGYFRQSGLNGILQANYIGSRFLDKRNRSKAEGYTTLSSVLAYRHHDWEIRFEGENLTDRRDPVAESELGDAQYYLAPARKFRLGWFSRF